MKKDRRLEMVEILISRDVVTAQELATMFGVSRRTIYRDINALSRNGIPVTTALGKHGGISLKAEFQLTRDQITETVGREFADSLQVLKESTAQSDFVLQKLAGVFPSQPPEWIDIEFSNWLNKGGEQEKFLELKKSILQRKAVVLSYHSISRGQQERLVEPLKLVLRGNQWHLLAYCRLKKGYRFFKLSKVKTLTITSENFESRGEIPALRQRSTIPKQIQPLVLLIKPDVINQIYEDFDASLVTLIKDGNYRLTCDVYDPEEIMAYVLSLGSAVECVQPEWLRNKLVGEVAGLKKTYL